MRSYFIFILLLSNLVSSQDLIQDTLNQKHTRWFNKFFIENFDKIDYWQDGFTDNFTTSSLYLENQDKNAYLGQEAKEFTFFGVNTHGKWKNPKSNIVFTGNLNIQKEYQNKKAWNNSPYEVKENGIMPDSHYFLVQRPGNWQNVKYDIFGAIQIPLFNQLKLKGSAKYSLEEKYRANLDPRTEVSAYQLIGKLGLNYQFNNNLVGVDFNMGNIDKSTDHTRVVRDQDTPYYYDKYLRWVWGYGSFFNNKKDNSRREGVEKSYSAYYTFQKSKSLFSIYLTKKTTEIKNFESKSKSNPNDAETNQLGASGLDEYNLDLYAQYQYQDKHKIYFLLNASHLKMNNFLDDLNGTSYRSKERNYNFQLSNVIYLNQLLNEYGVKINYQKYEQDDLFSEISTQGKVWSIGGFAEKEFKLNQLTISPYIEVSYKIRNHDLMFGKEPDFSNISKTDFLNLTRKAFYTEVIYNDHQLLDNHLMSAKLEPEFVFSASDKVKFSLRTGLELHYLFNVKDFNKFFNFGLLVNY